MREEIMGLHNKKLLVLSVSVGAGHKTVAEALCQVARDNFGIDAYHVNVLGYYSPTISRCVEMGWYLIVKYIPNIYKYIYYTTDKPDGYVKRRGKSFKINQKMYQKLIDEYNPDFIISTHFFPAAVVSGMYEKFPIPNGVIITDYVSHSMWAYPNNNRVFVSDNRMVKELEETGVDTSRICISGIPVRTSFLKPYSVEELRTNLGLDAAKPMLLLMGGGDSVGPYLEILNALSKVRECFQVIVIAGRNEKIRQSLDQRFEALGLQGKVLGFTQNIDDYMKSADLLISKAGGSTVTESLAVGLPMLIVRPTPGQEDGNTEFLTRENAAVYLKEVADIGEVVENLLKNPEQLQEKRQKAKSLSKPMASETILEEMGKLLKGD